MSNDEIKKALDAINTPFSELAKKMQADLSPLQTVLAQQDRLKDLVSVRPFIPDIPKLEIPVNQNLASEFHKRLIQWINDFDNTLDQEHEVGVRLVSFGQTVTFHLEDIGYWNPSLISFKGFTDQGEPVELIQHVSQISILLIKVTRKDSTQPKRPIGFGEWKNEGRTET